MKILFVNSFYRPHIGGGAELTLETLVEGIAGRGHRATVLSTDDGDGLRVESVGAARVYRAGIENLYWHFERELPNQLLRSLWHLRDRRNERMGSFVESVIRKETPDVISFHNIAGFSLAAWIAAFRLRIPTVQVLHDLYLMCPRGSTFRKGHACRDWCTDCSLLRREHLSKSRGHSAVVGISHYVMERMISNGFFREVPNTVIHNATVVGEVSKKDPIVADKPLIFGYIGALIPSKGVQWLIEEFRRCGGNNKLRIAGAGTKRYESVLRVLAEHVDIEFVGHVRSSEFFQTVDVAIVPSIWPEPLGRVAFEACAHNLPVIAAASGGLPEIIRDGVNGITCDPTDPSSLGKAISTLTRDRDQVEKLRLQARQSVAEFLDVDRMVRSYETVYRSASGAGN